MADWHHSPLHRLDQRGAYFVTSGTLQKVHHFRSATRLTLLEDRLLSLTDQYGWNMQGWAVFSNHYHFVAVSPQRPDTLRDLIRHLHGDTARTINREDGVEGRQVWFEYRETLLTFERSYLARLNYVLQNPVKHGLVSNASDYPWCSARWLESKTSPSYYQRISSLKTDKVNVPDDYDAVWDQE
jgi:putative transposase